MYFLIHCSEDGETRVETFTRAAIVEIINEGEINFEYADTIPHIDPAYWKGKAIIIKGEVVTPKAKTKVVEYEIP